MRLPIESTEADGPNLTPVIDVVFLLLIFFLVATRYDQQEREEDINVPEIAEAEPISMPSPLIVNVTKDGRYRVLMKEMEDFDERRLTALFEQHKRVNPHKEVLIRGDGESALKFATRIMSLCNKADLTYKLAALSDQ